MLGLALVINKTLNSKQYNVLRHLPHILLIFRRLWSLCGCDPSEAVDPSEVVTPLRLLIPLRTLVALCSPVRHDIIVGEKGENS